MNSRLVDLSGTLLFNRICAVVLALIFLGFTVWRFSMTERAPSKRRLRKLAKREAREAKIAAVAPALDGGRNRRARRRAVELGAVHGAAAGREPAGPDQPRPDRPRPVRDRQYCRGLVACANRPTARPIIRRSPRPSTASATAFQIILLMIAVFYGGELVWRERDRKLNEIIEFDAGPELGHDRPEDPRGVRRAAGRQPRGDG